MIGTTRVGGKLRHLMVSLLMEELFIVDRDFYGISLSSLIYWCPSWFLFLLGVSWAEFWSISRGFLAPKPADAQQAVRQNGVQGSMSLAIHAIAKKPSACLKVFVTVITCLNRGYGTWLDGGVFGNVPSEIRAKNTSAATINRQKARVSGG